MKKITNAIQDMKRSFRRRIDCDGQVRTVSQKLRESGFTLVELLIVVALLGALAAIMLPSLHVSRKHSDDAIIQSEMQEIQRAFVRFHNDCLPTTNQISELTNIYFAPLIDGKDYDAYDPARNRGWRGPYLVAEGIYSNLGKSCPAVLDPSGEPYRILWTNRNGQTNYFLAPSTNFSSTNLVRQLIFDS